MWVEIAFNISCSLSESDWLAIIPFIARPQSLAVRSDHYALAIAPVWFPFFILNTKLDLVSHFFQHSYCIRRKPLLEVGHVRKPLVMKPGRIDRFLNVHSVIHNSHQDIRDSCDDARTTR